MAQYLDGSPLGPIEKSRALCPNLRFLPQPDITPNVCVRAIKPSSINQSILIWVKGIFFGFAVRYITFINIVILNILFHVKLTPNTVWSNECILIFLAFLSNNCHFEWVG